MLSLVSDPRPTAARTAWIPAWQKWFNTEHTTLIWQLIDAGDLTSLQQLFETDPDLAYIRSEDGRGPLFWAYEYERWDVVQFLLDSGKSLSFPRIRLSTLAHPTPKVPNTGDPAREAFEHD